MIKRYEIYGYCHRCGSAEGLGGVEIEYDENKNGGWVGYHFHKTEVEALQNEIKELRNKIETLRNGKKSI